MNFALGHAISVRDLFSWFDISRLKMKKPDIVKFYKDGHTKRLAAQVFARCVEMVTDDIIENNVHFKIPTFGGQEPYLYMKRTTGEAFKQAYRNGKWNDVDIFASYMSGYQLALRLQYKDHDPWEKPVYVGKSQKNRITELTNKGKQY